MSNFLTRTALALSRGLAIHPLKARDKSPVLKGWPEKASRDPKQIAEWAEQFPDGNYGVVADDTFCILESDNFSELRELLGKSIPATYVVGARGNRPHIYFKQTPASKAAGNMDSPGLFEFKQNNKYVVGEGSVHPLGPEYKCQDSSEIVPIPDWLIIELIALRSGSDQRVSAPIPTDGSKLGAGEGRHPMLVSAAAKMWDGVIEESDFFDRVNELNQLYCDPPKPPGHVMDIVRHFMTRCKPIDRGPTVVLRGRKAELDPFDFVLASADGEDMGGGCFATGSVHLIQGASGTGKTTLGLQMLEAQKVGARFLGRKTFSKSYVVLMGDRGSGELKRTLHRMKMPDLPCVALTSAQMEKTPAVVISEIYQQNGSPQIVFIEGLDMWVKDQSKMDAVSKAISAMREVAAHYGFSLIGTVGTPKTKPKERYESFRDRAFGSSAWSRMVDTVLDIVIDPKTDERVVTLGHRNAKQESFEMEFVNGRLERKQVNIIIGPEEAMLRWFANNPDPDYKEVMARFSVSKTKAYELITQHKK